ncbi:MAG TPA: class I SAM-dependent methyltransferase [Bryobacteraceae bacterium]
MGFVLRYTKRANKAHAAARLIPFSIPQAGASYTDRLEPYDFSRVSMTALGPVIARAEYTDIPFAKEVLSALHGHSDPPSEEFLSGLRGHAPFFEARFKAVSRLLLGYRATQILELASGFSTRSLDPNFRHTTYVEVDLPKMIEQKRKIVTALLGSVPPHLHFSTANVLDRNELTQPLMHFRPGEPVHLTSEGLLRYLTFDEKSQLAENVRHILSLNGGAWITPDIHLKKWAPENRPPKSGVDWSFSAQLGRNINANYFDDLAHARSFFESHGFHVDEQPLLEGVRESIVSLPLASPGLLAELESRRIFTLTARS